MKKRVLLIAVAFVAFSLVFLLTTGLLAEKPDPANGGPWVTKVEGGGIVSGGSLSSYNVVETVLGWNIKVNADGVMKGHLNIVEKLENGKVRHFKLFSDEFELDFAKCNSYEVRIEGTDENGYRVAIHFRGLRNTVYPNSVWYWVKDGGTFITNTGARLTVSNTFYVTCD